MRLPTAVILLVLAVPAQPGDPPVDLVLIEKAARSLKLYAGKQEVAAFQVALGGSPEGKKECEGDEKTPEGSYVISGRNAKSSYHLSLRISYPSPADVANAKAKGCEPGGDIMIHGLRNGFGWVGASHAKVDWTLGCVAVTNEEIERIWRLVPNGTRVEIRA